MTTFGIITAIVSIILAIIIGFISIQSTVFIAKDLRSRKGRRRLRLEVENPHYSKIHRDGVINLIQTIDRFFDGPILSIHSLIICIGISAIYTLIVFLLSWSFLDGSGKIGETSLLPSDLETWIRRGSAVLLILSAVLYFIWLLKIDACKINLKRYLWNKLFKFKIRIRRLENIVSCLILSIVMVLTISSIWGIAKLVVWYTDGATPVGLGIGITGSLALVLFGFIDKPKTNFLFFVAGIFVISVTSIVMGFGGGLSTGIFDGLLTVLLVALLPTIKRTGKYSSIVFAILLIPIMIFSLYSCINYGDSLNNHVSALLFFIIIPCLNGIWDWISWYISRLWLWKISIEDSTVLKVRHAIYDALAATGLLICLTISLVGILHWFNIIIVNTGSNPPFSVNLILEQIKNDAFFGSTSWITFMLVSTLFPTFLHAFVIITGLMTPMLPRSFKKFLINTLTTNKSGPANVITFWYFVLRGPVSFLIMSLIVVFIFKLGHQDISKMLFYVSNESVSLINSLMN